VSSAVSCERTLNVVGIDRRNMMAHNGLKVLDSDMHCMEPRDLWERYIADAYKPVAPRGLQEYIADLRIVINGLILERRDVRWSTSLRTVRA
jgi:hypothetical protein